jgi:hypothetical protein
MGKKVTWDDLHNVHAKDLMKHYNLTERQLQQQLNRHLYGATYTDRQQVYKDVYLKGK